MNILLSANVATGEKMAQLRCWKRFNRSNSSFIDLNGEQVLNIADQRDFEGLTIDKIYLHESFFMRHDFYSALFCLTLRTKWGNVLELIDLSQSFQVLEKPKELTKWEKIKAFFSGNFEIKWG